MAFGGEVTANLDLVGSPTATSKGADSSLTFTKQHQANSWNHFNSDKQMPAPF
jgi:hypothetical protein